jgi:hypothetical protein
VPGRSTCLAPCSIVLVVLRTRSYRTLRDGSFGWRFSRHFVPGYDRTVSPGQFMGRQDLRIGSAEKVQGGDSIF